MTQSPTTPRQKQIYIGDPNPLGYCRARIRSSIDGWPTKSAGDKHHLLMTPPAESAKTLNRLNMYMGTVMGDRETPLSTVDQSAIRRRNQVVRTAIKAYRDDKQWADGLEATLVNRNGLDDVVVACMTSDELERVHYLLQAIWATHEDDLCLFGLRLPQPPAFLIEDLPAQQYREVFVAPGINQTTASREQIMIVLEAPKVGLHFVLHRSK